MLCGIPPSGNAYFNQGYPDAVWRVLWEVRCFLEIITTTEKFSPPHYLSSLPCGISRGETEMCLMGLLRRSFNARWENKTPFPVIPAKFIDLIMTSGVEFLCWFQIWSLDGRDMASRWLVMIGAEGADSNVILLSQKPKPTFLPGSILSRKGCRVSIFSKLHMYFRIKPLIPLRR